MTMFMPVIMIFAVLVFGTFLVAIARYKRCPSDKVLVVYGKVGQGQTSKCVHGGAAFIWPLIQDYRFLDLEPMTIDINLENALSKQNIRVNVPSRFTIGISTEPNVMTKAAERILSMDRKAVQDNANEIIFGQLRATLATMEIEEINANRDAFEKKVMDNVESELQKIGLKLINVNIKDITDESGYIEALGKKAAAEAINKAKIEVAKQDRDGAIGSADAKRDERVKVAKANAEAVQGENEAKITVADSDANRREREADAKKRGEAAERVKQAESLELGYVAEQKAEGERRKREQITQEISVVIPADVDRQKIEKEGEAEKARLTKIGEGEGARFKAILEKKAEGFKALVDSAGGDANKAAILLIVEQLQDIAKLQAEAISKINFEKIVVMDGGTGGGGNGSTTANWLSSITRILPGLHEFARMAGIELPETLGKALGDEAKDTGPTGAGPRPPEPKQK